MLARFHPPTPPSPPNYPPLPPPLHATASLCAVLETTEPSIQENAFGNGLARGLGLWEGHVSAVSSSSGCHFSWQDDRWQNASQYGLEAQRHLPAGTRLSSEDGGENYRLVSATTTTLVVHAVILGVPEVLPEVRQL